LEACKLGHISTVEEMLKDSPKFINKKDSNGQTALHSACYGGSISVVKLLVSHGADPKALNHKGKAPFYYAVSRGHVDIYKFLSSSEIVQLCAKFEFDRNTYNKSAPININNGADDMYKVGHGTY
jgi:ankyrin repeat protein